MTAPDPKLPEIASTLLQACLNNILHTTLLHRHREHKLLLASLDTTTKLPHCDRCNLPRLLEPALTPAVRGANTEPPQDTIYCDKKPWSRKPGYDIYGNPFPKADLTGRPPTKKERAEAANAKKGDGTPASNEGGTAPPSPTPVDEGDKTAGGKLEKGEKKANKIDEKLKKGEYVPWQTCPNCKRSLLIIRFAKHLEQCMGLAGRAASRNALAKMNGNGNGTGGTPGGSRGGTPAPLDGEEEGEEEERPLVRVGSGGGGVRKKVLKKGAVGGSKLRHQGGANATITANGKGNGSGVGTSGGSKRAAAADEDEEDEDDDDSDSNVHVKKRQKLQRVESQVSLGSLTEVESTQVESLDDGAYVNDAAVEDGSSVLGEEESFGDD